MIVSFDKRDYMLNIINIEFHEADQAVLSNRTTIELHGVHLREEED